MMCPVVGRREMVKMDEGGGEEQEDLFVFHYTIEGPMAPGGRATVRMDEREWEG
jgi:hypothetical protein